MSLCCVFNVGDVVLLAPVDQPIVAHLTVEMDGDNRLCVGCARRFKTDKVDAPVVRFDINKHGRRSRQRHAGRRCDVGH